MELNLNFTYNIILLVTSCIAWGVVAYLANQFYKKQTVKPKVWKLVIVILVGLFSFSIHLNLFQTMIKLPILPLGVWIIYFFTRGKNWQIYRVFAWLGFWANFIFLATTLLAGPIHHVVYPKDEPKTYIATLEDASIVPIHPSSKDGLLNKDILENELPKMKQETIYSDQWYQDTYMSHNALNERDERFPYQLVDTSAKWGSGLHSIIFVENDGKGLLITTAKDQLYFRFDESIIEGVE